MEYTPEERYTLSLMERTDFKNPSKAELVSFASKLGSLRPEVAKAALSQYPELVGLIKTAIPEFKGMLDSVIKSDDESINQYFGIATKEIENAEESRKQFFSLLENVRSDYAKCLEEPDLTFEQQMEILDREMDLVKLADKKDSEVRQQEHEIREDADRKDSEKRSFNWKLVGGISAALVMVVGVGAGVLGGNFNIKLPGKS